MSVKMSEKSLNSEKKPFLLSFVQFSASFLLRCYNSIVPPATTETFRMDNRWMHIKEQMTKWMKEKNDFFFFSNIAIKWYLSSWENKYDLN